MYQSYRYYCLIYILCFLPFCRGAFLLLQHHSELRSLKGAGSLRRAQKKPGRPRILLVCQTPLMVNNEESIRESNQDS